MEKLNDKKKIKICVFISGRGTNLKSLINFSKQKKTNFEIILIVSNKKNAKGLNFAIKNNIKSLIINYKNKKKTESIILKILKKNSIELVCLAGFMKILSKKIIKKYPFEVNIQYTTLNFFKKRLDSNWPLAVEIAKDHILFGDKEKIIKMLMGYYR